MTFGCHMSLEKFPFDEQTCALKMESCECLCCKCACIAQLVREMMFVLSNNPRFINVMLDMLL